MNKLLIYSFYPLSKLMYHLEMNSFLNLVELDRASKKIEAKKYLGYAREIHFEKYQEVFKPKGIMSRLRLNDYLLSW
jgi:hypothetical protein